MKSLSATSSLLVEHPTDDTDSELSIHSDRISPTLTHISIDVLDDKDVQIDAENTNLNLSNEMNTLNCEHINKQAIEVHVQNGILYKFYTFFF